MSLTLAVIGHVNHGKTALVRALTGMETDRLKAEIERGLSITLGFAWCDGPAGPMDLIDAPGHEDFIRAMVSGATGVRAALLVVSAVEGVAKQTREHLQIADLLGIRAGVIAVSKADLLPPGGEAAVLARIATELGGSFLAGEPMILCSAVSGGGMDRLRAALDGLARRAPGPAVLPGVFLPIDRAFTITGAGTVVTGTLQGGALAAGDEAVLLPSQRRVGVRQIQVHGEARAAVEPGGRVAVALRGIPADAAGEALCAPDAFAATLQVDVEITLAAGVSRPLKHMDQVRILWGARHDTATVRLFGEAAVAPGGRALARLRFAAPVVAYAGQRAILRRPSPAETIAGLVVLDPDAPAGRVGPAERSAILEAAAAGNLPAIAAALAQRDGVVSVAELRRLSRRPNVATEGFEALDADRLAQSTTLAAVREAYLSAVADAHRREPARPMAAVGAIRARLTRTFPRDLVAHVEHALAAAGAIRLQGADVALPGHDPFAALSPEALARLSQMEADLRDGGLMPPAPASLVRSDTQSLLDLLVGSGRAITLYNGALRQTLVFHSEALTAAADALRAAFPPPSEFTTGEAREALATTRKFIVPVLEHLDTRGVTIRRGDVRQVIG